MKILLLTPFYAIDKQIDLYEDNRAIHYFTKHWVKENCDVTVIHTYFHPLKQFKKDFLNSLFIKKHRKFYKKLIDGVNVLLYFNRKYNIGLPRLSYFQQFRITRDIQNILDDKKRRPDIIVAHFPTLYLKIFRKLNFNYQCPIVGVFHNLDIQNLKKSKNVMEYRNAIKQELNAIGFRSKIIEKQFNEYVCKHTKYSFLVYSGVPNNILQTGCSINVEKSKKMRILYAGKLIHSKNVHTILEALKRLDDKYNFEFKIIGDGEKKQSLKKFTKELNFNNNIAYSDQIPRENLFDEMMKSDIFVMPSINETLGLVYFEAMANGCITIGSRGEGIDGIIEDGVNGFLVEPSNIEELTKVFMKIFNLDETEQKFIKQNSINKMKKFTEKNVADMYLQNLKNIIV